MRPTTARYFDLAAGTDLEAYFAQFHSDALVEDDGHEYRGITEITQWRTEVPDVVYRPGREDGDDIDAEIAGEFPGSPVTLHFHFEFDQKGLITVLRIRP